MELLLEDKCYIAGIIDGEGTVTLIKNSPTNKPNENRTLSITVASTSLELLKYLKQKCGGSISSKKIYKKHHKKSWHWGLGVNASLKLLKHVFPYLKEKEKIRRADLILKNYKKLTPRNGKYTPEISKARKEFVMEFFKNSNSSTLKI